MRYAANKYIATYEMLYCSCDLLAHSLLAAAEADNALLTSFVPWCEFCRRWRHLQQLLQRTCCRQRALRSVLCLALQMACFVHVLFLVFVATHAVDAVQSSYIALAFVKHPQLSIASASKVERQGDHPCQF
jgi:hypothetical protein